MRSASASPRPDPGPAAGWIGPEERLEHARQVDLRDPFPGVLHGHGEATLVLDGLDPDRAVGWRVPDGVHQEVLQHADQARRAGRAGAPSRSETIASPFSSAVGSDRRERRANDVVQARARGLGLDRPGVELRQLEQVVHHRDQLLDGAAHLARVPSDGRRRRRPRLRRSPRPSRAGWRAASAGRARRRRSGRGASSRRGAPPRGRRAAARPRRPATEPARRARVRRPASPIRRQVAIAEPSAPATKPVDGLRGARGQHQRERRPPFRPRTRPATSRPPGRARSPA